MTVVFVLKKRKAKPVKHKGSKKTEEEFDGSSGLFCVFVLKKGKLSLLNTKDQRAQKNGFDGQSLDDWCLCVEKRKAKPVKHKGSKKTEE